MIGQSPPFVKRNHKISAFQGGKMGVKKYKKTLKKNLEKKLPLFSRQMYNEMNNAFGHHGDTACSSEE